MWAYINIQPGEHIYEYMGGAYIWDVNWVTYLRGISWGHIYREHINGILWYVKKHQSAVIYKVLYLLKCAKINSFQYI